MFNGGYELALGMNLAEAVIIALLIAQIVLAIVIARGTARNTAQGIQYLDQNIAEALKSILEQLPDAMSSLVGSVQNQEPPNPIQMMIMEMMQRQLNPSLQVTEIQPQDPQTGQFKKLDEF